MSVPEVRYFPLWMVVFGYKQIQIKPKDQHNTTFICPWGTCAYQKMPFGLKNDGATFQRL